MLRVLLLCVALLPPAAVADDALWALLKKGGQVVLIRHAVTESGPADPPGFSLADCKTQRNLSAEGRAEAARLGKAFRDRAIPVTRVLSSPWCRCQETAKIAFGGAQTETALGMYVLGANLKQRLAAFRKLVAQAPKDGNLILITHSSTVLDFTGESPNTAELVIVTPEAGGNYRLAGRIPAPG